MIYVPNMPHATKPVSVGWQFSTVMLLPEQPSSWVGVLEQRRISTEQTAIEVGIEQLRAVVPHMQPAGDRVGRSLVRGRTLCAGLPRVGCCALIRLKPTANCIARHRRKAEATRSAGQTWPALSGHPPRHSGTC